MRLLLIEDDAMIGKGVRQSLLNAGFAVDEIRRWLRRKVVVVRESAGIAIGTKRREQRSAPGSL